MFARKRPFNYKARENSSSNNSSNNNEVELDETLLKGSYDESNLLALPSKRAKLEEKKVTANPTASAPLSKKKRKALQKVLEKKQTKFDRKEILKEAVTHDLTVGKLNLMLQSNNFIVKGIPRNQDSFILEEAHSNQKPRKANSLKGAKKNQIFQAMKPKKDLIVLDGFDDESDSDESDSNEHSHSNGPDNHVHDDLEKVTSTISSKQHLLDSRELSIENTINLNDAHIKSSPEMKPIAKVIPDKADSTLLVKDNVSHILGSDTLQTKPVVSIVDRKPSVFVPVSRTKAIQEARSQLPIIGMEQQIIEAVSENPVVIICGETGSGKTTQIPQFLYECGFAKDGKKIGITEPRRVAAMAMSDRVAEELNLSEKEVSYLIRYEGNMSQQTKILFMTDGVLFKFVQQDIALPDFSVIIIDEAHERSKYSDLLIGTLSKMAVHRHQTEDPLKLIIMSATLRVEDFTENPRLFKVPPPVINVESRQYSVTNYFSKVTPSETEYLDFTYKKICKINNKLPPGGILVFVTSQSEVKYLCRKLKATFNKKPSQGKKRKFLDEDNKNSDNLQDAMKPSGLNKYDVEPTFESDSKNSFEEILEDEEDEDDNLHDNSTNNSLYVLPLYSLLPADEQRLVFQTPPEDSRLCVISTNIAETSVTIPNIKYVVDTGKVKTKNFDLVSGASRFDISCISKSSAEQRSGRAGRTAPGHCYRLYSSNVYNNFEQYSQPEILRLPLDDVVLQIKRMGVHAVNFPFPSNPPLDGLKASEERLTKMGAINQPKDAIKDQWRGNLSVLGRKMSNIALNPHLSKILIESRFKVCLPYTIVLLSALSVQEVFLDPANGNEEERNFWSQIKQSWTKGVEVKKLGDFALLLKAALMSQQNNYCPKFCRKFGLRLKAVEEIGKLRKHIAQQFKQEFPNVNLEEDSNLKPPTDHICRELRNVLLSGMVPHGNVARQLENPKGAYQCLQLDKAVYIHPSSVLSKAKSANFIIYQEIIESSKPYMKNVCIIDPMQIPVHAYKMCTFSSPKETPSPRYDPVKDTLLCHMDAKLGLWDFPATEVPYPDYLQSRFIWFAFHLLNGDVIPKFKEFESLYNLKPSNLMKAWSHLKPQTKSLTNALQSKNVFSKKTLLKAWNQDADYLLREISEWINPDQVAEVQIKWRSMSESQNLLR